MDDEDTRFVLVDIVMMIRPVRVEQQEFDFLSLNEDLLLGQINIAAAIYKNDTTEAMGVVGILVVGVLG